MVPGRFQLWSTGVRVLVLSRRIGERVLIGRDVTVSVVQAKGGRARLAFTAPAHVTIDREEVRRNPIRRDGRVIR
jgi:carbon storage regulator CsrA